MDDRDAFERRFEEVVRAYADRAPTTVDPAALTRSLAQAAPRRVRVRAVPLVRLPAPPFAWRVAAVAIVVVLAAGLLASGAIRQNRSEPGASVPGVTASVPGVALPTAQRSAGPTPFESVPASRPAATPPSGPGATYGAVLAWSGFARLPRLHADLPLPFATMGDVTVGGPGFVAVGGDIGDDGRVVPVAWSSADGVAWEEHVVEPSVVEPAGGPPLTGVVAGDGMLVAVGAAGAWTSDDGTSWRESATAAILGGVPEHVARGGSRFVAIGRGATDPCSARAWTSTDGRRWDSVAIAGSFCPTGLAGAGDRFLAVGYDAASGAAAVMSSADGTSWRAVPAQDAFDGAGHPEGVASTAGGWIAFGSFQPATAPEPGIQVWASPDGTTWRRTGFLRPTGPFSCDPASAHMRDVAAFGPGYVAVGGCTANPEEVGVAWTSADGARWQSALGRVRPMVAVAADGQRLVVVGADWPDHEPVTVSAVIRP